MQAIGVLLGLGAFIFALFCAIKFYSTIYRKRVRGPGLARAEYGRIMREAPQSPDAQLSEAEFVQKYLDGMDSPAKWVALALLAAFILLPVSCSLVIRGSH